MTMDIVGKAKGQVLIIEGPDGVGKTTFINHLMDFLRGQGIFKSLLSPEVIEEHATNAKSRFKGKRGNRKGGRERVRRAEREKLNRMIYGEMSDPTNTDPKGVYATVLKSIMDNGVPFSAYVANIRDGSPENREFYRRLLAGEITDEREIVLEYLKAHWDLHNYIEQLREMHDLVIVDRALPSMFVSQIRACGQSYAERNYNLLLEKTGQNNHMLWILTAPDEVILERCNVRGNDEQGKKLTEHLAVIKAAYKELQESGQWRRSQFVDISGGPHDHLGLFTLLASNVISYVRQFSLMR